jgi:hypothetical protein
VPVTMHDQGCGVVSPSGCIPLFKFDLSLDAGKNDGCMSRAMRLNFRSLGMFELQVPYFDADKKVEITLLVNWENACRTLV